MMHRRLFFLSALAAATLFAHTASVENVAAQALRSQTTNEVYAFDNANPAYEDNSGPVITVHRYVSPYVQRGRFEAFGKLSQSDGFQVKWLDKPVTNEVLEASDIFVIANAYTKGGQQDYRNFGTLDAPSVYSADEMAAITSWIRQGGSLLLLADHSPFAGGTIKLAEQFGFLFMTGSAIHRSSTAENIIAEIDFRKDAQVGFRIGKLADHPITTGGLDREPINQFYTFSGQAIIPPADAVNLLTIPNDFETILTFAIRRDFNSAGRLDASGFSQGAVLEFGEGRLAVFGETGAFTSQIINETDFMGLGAPEAPQNEEFVLSTLRWLARYEPE